jgi:hypothetical protein
MEEAIFDALARILALIDKFLVSNIQRLQENASLLKQIDSRNQIAQAQVLLALDR